MAKNRKKQKNSLNKLFIGILCVVIGFSIVRLFSNPKTPQNIRTDTTQNIEKRSTLTVEKKELVDKYVEYTLPNGWKKDDKVNSFGTVEFTSPNFRYNSTEGEDEGLMVRITRNKYTSTLDLGSYLLEQNKKGNNFDNYEVSPVTIGTVNGYSFSSINDGIGSDPNYPNYAILNDGYLYTIQFAGRSGKGLEKDITEFLSSFKFKE